MEELGKSRWEGNEHWFKFGHQAGLKRFDEISTLGSTATAVALRSVKYQLEMSLALRSQMTCFVRFSGRSVISGQCQHLAAMLHWSSSNLYRESSKNMVFQGIMLEQSGEHLEFVWTIQDVIRTF